MKTIELVRVVLFGEPAQKYAVTFRVGGDPLVKIQGPGRRGPSTVHWLRWYGKAFRPGCQRMTEAAIAHFLQLEASGDESDVLEQGNAELMVAGRVPASRRRPDFHERQLPAGDRAEVG